MTPTPARVLRHDRLRLSRAPAAEFAAAAVEATSDGGDELRRGADYVLIAVPPETVNDDDVRAAVDALENSVAVREAEAAPPPAAS